MESSVLPYCAVLEFLVFVSAAVRILGNRTALRGDTTENGLDIRWKELIVLDFKDFDRIVKDRIGRNILVEHVVRIQSGAQRFIKRHAHFLRRMDVRFAHIIDDNRRAQKTCFHLAVDSCQHE